MGLYSRAGIRLVSIAVPVVGTSQPSEHLGAGPSARERVGEIIVLVPQGLSFVGPPDQARVNGCSPLCLLYSKRAMFRDDNVRFASLGLIVFVAARYIKTTWVGGVAMECVAIGVAYRCAGYGGVSVARSFMGAPLHNGLMRIVVSTGSISTPLYQGKRASTLTNVRMVVAVVVCVNGYRTIHPTRVVGSNLSPFYFYDNDLFTHAASPLRSIFVVVKFLCKFGIRVVNTMFVASAPPNGVPSFSSLVVFYGNVAVYVVVVMFVGSIRGEDARKVAVKVSP